jgi:hypothetical protein
LLRRAFRKRDGACLEAAWFLATLPFALGVLSAAAGAALAVVAGSTAVAVVLATALAGLVMALVAAPWYVGWKAVVQVKALASLVRKRTYYPPTARA